MRYSFAIVVMLCGCEAFLDSALQQSSTPCVDGSLAIPNDGVDDRVALQSWLDNGCRDSMGWLTVQLDAGTYEAVTRPEPPDQRPPWVLRTSVKTRIVGMGEDRTTLRFSGNAQAQDWHGLLLGGDDVQMDGVRVETHLENATNEQTHAIRAVGPKTRLRLERLTINHPHKGDCMQLVGYDATPITNLVIDHVTFENCGRSCYAYHSGTRNLEFTNNVNAPIVNGVRLPGARDQCFDGEGGEDVGEPLLINALIAHNEIDTGPGWQGGLSVQIVHGRDIHFHSNKLRGRGYMMASCVNCRLDHNEVTQSVPSDYAAGEIFKGSDNVDIHDDVYTRTSGANPGAAVAITQKISAPKNIRIRNTTIVQETTWHGLVSSGAVGVTLNRVTLDNRSGAPMQAVSFEGTRTTPEVPGVRTTDLHVIDARMIGPWKAAVRLSGAYDGAGSLEIARTRAPNSTRGLWCEDDDITGPIILQRNEMAAPLCGGR